MKLLDILVCDDIRFEIGDKNTLVGLYSDINIAQKKGQKIQWPVIIKLGIFIRCIVEDMGETPDAFSLEIIHATKGTIHTANGIIKMPIGVKYFNLALVNNYIIPNIGKINFKLHFIKEGKEIQYIEPEYTFDVGVKEIE